MRTPISFSFPIDTAGIAIHSLPAGTYNITITGVVTRYHKMAEVAGALKNNHNKYINLDLSQLEGLQFIGMWETGESRDNSENIGFRGAVHLVSIILPDNLEFIGNHAFDSCYALEKVQLPESLRSIGSGAFGNCASLRELAIPEGVELIDDYAFSGCSALEKLQLPGHFKQYDIQSRLDIPNRVEITYSDCL